MEAIEMTANFWTPFIFATFTPLHFSTTGYLTNVHSICLNLQLLVSILLLLLKSSAGTHQNIL